MAIKNPNENCVRVDYKRKRVKPTSVDSQISQNIDDTKLFDLQSQKF